MVTVAEALATGTRAIRQQEPEIVADLLRAYDLAWRAVERELAVVEQRIAEAIAAGIDPKPSWVRQQAWWQSVERSIDAEMQRFQNQAVATITRGQTGAVLASAESAGLFAQAVGINAGIVGRVNPGAMERWVSALQPNSPIRGVFARYGPRMEAVLIESITSGLGSGQGVGGILREIRRRAGTDAVQGRIHTTARTELLRAYRGASQDQYEAMNRETNVITAYEWRSARDSRTCILCLSMDGQRFRSYPTSQHISCRCVVTPVPDPSLVPPVGRPREAGLDWFERQPETVKREIMPTEAHWELYEAGVNPREFVGVKRSRTWGDSIALRSARSLQR